MLILLQVIVPAMMLWLHSQRLEVLLFGSSFTFFVLPCGFTPTDKFMLWQLLNHDGMYKLSQLSVSINFTLRVTCLDLFPYMLAKVSIQSIGHASHVLRLI
jgi:hypothetical protein